MSPTQRASGGQRAFRTLKQEAELRGQRGDVADEVRCLSAQLRQVDELRDELLVMRAAAVSELRRMGFTYAEVGALIGVTKSRAQQIALRADGRERR